jgi:hypothetical protein
MDTVTMQDLKFLSTCDSRNCVSLFMPAHRARPQTEQDPIRLKNLLRLAEERLAERGLSKKDIEPIMEAPRRLLNDFSFWERQGDGLAVFFSKEIMRTFRLPLVFSELVVVAENFHIKPLLPLLVDDGRFFLLSLSQKEVRLFEGSRHEIEEVNFPDGLSTLEDLFGEAVFTKDTQARSATRSTPARGGYGVFHGHDPQEDEKKHLLSWMHVVDEEIAGKINESNSPLVVACVDYLFPLYQEANTYHKLAAGNLPGNPEDMSVPQLHKSAWDLVHTNFKKERLEAAARYADLSATGKSTDEIDEAVLAAIHGRVDTLFVEVGSEIWGSYDEEQMKVIIHQRRETCDTDLTNLAAIHTLLSGGSVFPLSPVEGRIRTPVQAIFRY